MTKFVLEARGLTKKQEGNLVLNDVHFHLSKGESVAFLGDDASANKTLLEVLSTMRPADKGDLFINGLNTSYELKRTKMNLGYLSTCFDNEISLLSNLDIYSRLYDIPKKQIENRISELLRIYDLEEYMGNSPKDLSRINQFKLAFVRIKIINPDIVFYEEDFSAYNDEELVEVFELIENIKQESALLMTTKSPVYAYKIADKVAIFTNAKIYEYDDASDLSELANDVIEFKFREDEVDYFISKLPKSYEYHLLNDRFYLFIKDSSNIQSLLSLIHSDEVLIRKPDIRDLLIRHKSREEVDL